MPEGNDREAPPVQGGTGSSQVDELDSRADRLIAALAEGFSDDGVAIADWERAAAKSRARTGDRFLRIHPEKAVANVATVVEHFAPDGLTTKQYLQAVLKQPLLLGQQPGTLIGNIQAVVRHFAADGLTTRRYLRAAQIQPTLWTLKPETAITNVEQMIDHFADDGLTRRDYVRAASTMPQLFGQRPETLIRNIERVVEGFSSDGLTRPAYLEAAVKLPALFTRRSDSIIERINILASMHQKHLLPILPGKAAFMDFITTRPMLLTLSRDNLHLREIAVHIAETPDATAPMRANRPDVEETVAHALRHGNGDARSEKVSHARRLLLNALKREGYLKGK